MSMNDRREFIEWAIGRGYSELTADKIWCVIKSIKSKGIDDMDALNKWLHRAPLSKATKSKYRYSFRVYLEFIQEVLE